MRGEGDSKESLELFRIFAGIIQKLNLSVGWLVHAFLLQAQIFAHMLNKCK